MMKRRRCGNVRLRDGTLWRFDHLCLAAARNTTKLAMNNRGDVYNGVFEALGISSRQRRLDNNRLRNKDGTGPSSPKQSFASNKGLSMELLTAATLTCIDSPDFVHSWCVVEQPGLPYTFASGGYVDISASYGDAFNIVAEVSARQGPTPEDFAKQLDQAIRHADLKDGYDKGAPTYALVITDSNIETDKECLAAYRDAVRRANETRADLHLIPIWIGHWAEFAAAIAQAVDAEEKTFGKIEFATLLDELYQGLSRTEHDPEIGWTFGRLMAAAGRERELPLPPQTTDDDLPDLK